MLRDIPLKYFSAQKLPSRGDIAARALNCLILFLVLIIVESNYVVNCAATLGRKNCRSAVCVELSPLEKPFSAV
jgi:hypothetical protein